MPIFPDSRRFPGLLLAAVLAIALLLRGYWALQQPASSQALDRSLPDQAEYEALGRNLLDHGSLSFVDARYQQRLFAQRTPGYPLFVAACGASPRVVRVAQAFLDVSTVLAVYLIARRLMGSRATGAAALIAAGLVAFNPFLVYFSGLLLSETLFVAMLTWGVALLVYARVRARWVWKFLPGGLVLALSVLVRPSAAVLVPVMVMVAAGVHASLNPPPQSAYHRRGALVRNVLAGAVLGCILLVVVLFPWAYRNHRVLGRWVWTTTNGGITLYDGFNPDATGASDQSNPSFVAQRPVVRQMSELQRNDYFATLARQYITGHPARVAYLAIAKIARTWSPLPLSEQFGRRTGYVIIALLYSIPLDILLLVGLWRRNLTPRGKALLLTPAIYLTVIHALSVGSLRYRLPAEPLLAVIAAAAIPAWLRRGAIARAAPTAGAGNDRTG